MSSLLLTSSFSVTLSADLAFSVILSAACEATNLIAASTTVALVITLADGDADPTFQ
jgi:hypothetical protein